MHLNLASDGKTDSDINVDKNDDDKESLRSYAGAAFGDGGGINDSCIVVDSDSENEYSPSN
tara:strand:- start:302 stop:484 length:183 start_codon:yes stop_codon:yes gene_type:complete